jgi:hypothetical protein
MRIAQWVNIALLTLVAGVFWGTWFSLSRSMPSITPGTFLEIGRTMIQHLARPTSILMPVAMLSTLPVLFLLFRRKAAAALYVAIAGLMLFVGRSRSARWLMPPLAAVPLARFGQRPRARRRAGRGLPAG